MNTSGDSSAGYFWKSSLKRLPMGRAVFSSSLMILSLISGCAQTEIIESPKTAYVADAGTPKDPLLIWTSRTVDQPFDYLGQIKARSWTYDGALERLKEAGRELRADAVIDIHFERLGFFKTMHAFAIKFKD